MNPRYVRYPSPEGPIRMLTKVGKEWKNLPAEQRGPEVLDVPDLKTARKIVKAGVAATLQVPVTPSVQGVYGGTYTRSLSLESYSSLSKGSKGEGIYFTAVYLGNDGLGLCGDPDFSLWMILAARARVTGQKKQKVSGAMASSAGIRNRQHKAAVLKRMVTKRMIRLTQKSGQLPLAEVRLSKENMAVLWPRVAA